MPGFAVNGYYFDSLAHGSLPLGAITGRADTKAEQNEGGREALVSGPTEPAGLTHDPPLRDRSGERRAADAAASAGAERKLSGA